MPFIRDDKGDILSKRNEIKNRWQQYFNLLNVENDSDERPEVYPVEGPISNITRKEVEAAIKKIKSGKAAGCLGFERYLVWIWCVTL